MSNINYQDILERGEIALEGRFLWGSNYTLLTKVIFKDQVVSAVYKPTQGERPLWDFPIETLALREAAAYIVSESLKWHLVPPTVYRKTGPLGPGSLQLFIQHDPEYHYFNFTLEDQEKVRTVVAFDVIINNADRKGGHLLFDAEHHMWAIDHGICFHVEPKLRTVLWNFAGQPIPDNLCSEMQTFSNSLTTNHQLKEQLNKHLTKREIEAMRKRTENLLIAQIFPHPPKNSRPYPWPLI